MKKKKCFQPAIRWRFYVLTNFPFSFFFHSFPISQAISWIAFSASFSLIFLSFFCLFCKMFVFRKHGFFYWKHVLFWGLLQWFSICGTQLCMSKWLGDCIKKFLPKSNVNESRRNESHNQNTTWNDSRTSLKNGRWTFWSL